ncbi:MAG: TIGR02301 family protein [Devosia nanyangense]|uniref:TIGR02301 family protein n=1 Tax=Devosia nanyangense TaxID=1228055 RepID=A0A933NZC2_9HYPH|nr:TIGR02301 family protein [Devosia nanyangense]
MRLPPSPFLFALLLTLALPHEALAVDPPYEPQMERLAEVLGSLYFLNPLCKPDAADWRKQMADLVKLDQPDEDRQQRLFGAFNAGYAAYARLYRICTPSAEEALTRLLVEAESTAREIHSRYAE